MNTIIYYSKRDGKECYLGMKIIKGWDCGYNVFSIKDDVDRETSIFQKALTYCPEGFSPYRLEQTIV